MNAEEQRWSPTHVQVTVLRGRGLRGKGKHGTSDVYTIIQVGKEKYSTCVSEKTTSPEWKEECTFELPPGALDTGGRSVYPPGSGDLVLTVMHRALIGLDVFLGQAVVPLDKIFQDNICLKNEWYRLNSKTGKKEKERGDIQVTVQFTRNNLTASMYDLAMKDKGHSTFSKLKERIRGRKRCSAEEESSSAIVPGGYGAVDRMRNRLPSDGGGEEEYEDDEGGEARRSKMRNFFLRGKLRKSSDTRSSTSLGSESSESSSRGGSLSPTAGISVVVSDLSNSPSNSSNLTADSPAHTADTSPKLSPDECDFGDEADIGGEISIAVPQRTVNGGHAYHHHPHVQPLHPGSGNPTAAAPTAPPPGLRPLQKPLALSTSLQNLSPRAPELPRGPAGDGRRWSFDKADEEEKAAIAAALEKSGPMQGDEEEEEEEAGRPDDHGKTQRRNLFSHGRSEAAGRGAGRDESEQAPAPPAEEKHKGWFGSKDSHSKPSLVMSPTKLESSTDPHLPPLPRGLPGPPVDPGALSSPLHHTNPFSPTQTTPPPMSPGNPFFSLVQSNPFYGGTLTNRALKPELPPLPYLSSSRPPIAQLSLLSSPPDPVLSRDPSSSSTEGSVVDMKGEAAVAGLKRRPLPPVPPEENVTFTSGGTLETDAEWDDSFEVFAAGRLQSPEGLASERTQRQKATGDGPPLARRDDEAASLSTTDSNLNTNVNRVSPRPPTSDVPSHASTESSNEIGSRLNHFHAGTPVGFARSFNSVPPREDLEGDREVLATSVDAAVNSHDLNVCLETKLANNTANTTGVTTNTHNAFCHDCYHVHSTLSPCSGLKLDKSDPPNPGSSGVGSSPSLSPYSASERFSVSSYDDVEAQDLDCCILDPIENSSEPQGHSEVEDRKHSEMDILEHSEPSEVEIRENSEVEIGEHFEPSEEILEYSETQDTVIEKPGDLSLDSVALGESKSPERPCRPSTLTTTPPWLPAVTVKEVATDDALIRSLSLPAVPCPDLRPKPSVSSRSEKEDGEEGSHGLKESLVDFFDEVDDSTKTKNTRAPEADIPTIPDDENSQKYPTFRIVTSSPGDEHSPPGSPTDGSGSGKPDVTGAPPRPRTGLANDLLDISAISDISAGLSPVLGFDGALTPAAAGGSDRSPSSLCCPSLYESVDSEQYLTCTSLQSSRCSEGMAVPGRQADMLLSTNSTLREGQTYDDDDEMGEFQCAVGVESVGAFCSEGWADSRRPPVGRNDQSEFPRLGTATTLPLEPRFTIGDNDLGLRRTPDTLTDSNSKPDDLTACVGDVGGVVASRRVPPEDLFPEQPALQRSLSEGAMATGSEDLASFGSDPCVARGSSSSSASSSSARHDSDLPLLLLTSSTPSLTAERSSPVALRSSFPAPPATAMASPPPGAASPTALLLCAAKPAFSAPRAVSPTETERRPPQAANQQNSPHPVKPLSTAMLGEEKRSEGRSVLASGLEKLKFTIHAGRSSQLTEQEQERKKSVTGGAAGSYYHLNHGELVALLVRREAELEGQRAEYERRGALLAKRELELKKLKPQVRDLEDYIDTLLVRIMEQTPTLLQVRTKFK